MKKIQSIVSVASLSFILAACGGMAPEPASEPSPIETSSSSSAYDSSSSVEAVQYWGVDVGDRVFFATDQASIDGLSRTALRAQAEWLAQNASTNLVIEGHADERGTREYNLALGARRANAVRDFLISQGVDSDRLETISFGKERPVSLCSDESCWSKNRRAVSTTR